MGTSSAAGGEQPDQGDRGVPPDGVVDVALLAPALDQARTAEDVEVVRQGRARHLDRLLNLASGDLAPGPHQEEEHLEAGEVGQGPECLDVLLGGLELDRGQRVSLCHDLNYLER